VCRHEQSLATYRQFNRSAPSHNDFINKHKIYYVAIFFQNGINIDHLTDPHLRHRVEEITLQFTLCQELFCCTSFYKWYQVRICQIVRIYLGIFHRRRTLPLLLHEEREIDITARQTLLLRILVSQS
jgi:hypothetical protein